MGCKYGSTSIGFSQGVRHLAISLKKCHSTTLTKNIFLDNKNYFFQSISRAMTCFSLFQTHFSKRIEKIAFHSSLIVTMAVGLWIKQKYK